MKVSQGGRPLPGILVGHHEAIFDALPGNVIDNFRRRASENALLWNKLYPFSRKGFNLRQLLAIKPLWGTQQLGLGDDGLQAYFWGYRADGALLEGLNQALAAVDGPGPRTEVDCFLLGDDNLVLIEAKRASGFGRCSRYNSSSCPALHLDPADLSLCRYWDEPSARFKTELTFSRPEAGAGRPACDRHYQLARTLLVGRTLANSLKKRLHLWLVVPQRRWRGLERDWIDFTGSVINSDLWRRMRVMSWESLEAPANQR